MVAELFAGMNIGQMHFDSRQAYSGNRVTDRITVMCERAPR